MRTRSRSARRRDRIATLRPRRSGVQPEEEEHGFQFSDADSTHDTDDSDGEADGRSRYVSRVPVVPRRWSARASGLSDFGFTRNLEELQTMWDRARAQNAELRGQLRKAQEQSGSHKQGQGSLNANDLAERVYSLLGDNAELRRENRRLLEQSRRRNGRQYSSGSDSEPSGDKPQSSTVLNSDDVSAKKSHRVSVPEVVASNGNNNDNTELVQSARADERTMRLLLRCVTRITQETARYERKKCDKCLKKRKLRSLFKLSCGHVLCTFCMVPHDLIEPSPQRLCLVCKQAFAETAPLRIYQIKEESWAKLRAIAAKWAELDSDPLGELDDGLKAELAELCKRATQAEDESEAEDSEEEVEMNVT